MLEQVLIIEDDDINRMIFEKIFTNDFMQLDFACDGQQGIDMFIQKRYSLVILDLGLPKISGLQVARLIRQFEAAQRPVVRIPILVVTADNFPGTRRAAMDAGADHFFTKPFNTQELQQLAAASAVSRRDEGQYDRRDVPDAFNA